MRIGELSRRTGVSVPTIKFYVREGLLPAGRLTSPNQASYEEAHVRRLRLIRALLDVGGLSVAAIREVIAAIDDPERPVHKMLGEAAARLVPRYERASGGAARAENPAEGSAAVARERVEEIIAARGWRTYRGNPAGEALVAALQALEEVGHGRFAEVLDVYAEAAEKVARADLEYVARNVAREDLVESVVVGTVLGDAVFESLRRLAHVDASDRLFGREEAPGEATGPVAPDAG
ncbi:MerR family transcriptional regulator [Streptomyces sp.]|uniref:MerR family transcriptional regulator n=1 Tax=Streptomyces sp. TaxID=1931 RepID=UPI0028124521|nr:MerR family transcriptional regulator [Streptomyces sp.]